MRLHILATLLLPTLLTACASIHRLLPEGPALSEQEHAELAGPAVPSRVRYTGDPQVAFPVLPVQLWGLHYAIDIVLVSDHPDWTMHEYARIDLPDQSLWIAKDADANGDQHVVAELEDIESWLPEIPVPRTAAAVNAQDASDEQRVDLRLETHTPDGEAVVLRFEGARPQGPPGKRNGSTMEHSRQAVAAVLDLAGQQHGGDVTLEIGGEPRGIERVLGIYSMKFVLDQHQAGFAVASFEQRPTEAGFELERPAAGVDWPTRGLERWTDDGRTLRRDDPIITLSYEMPLAAGTSDARELQGARVEQAGHDIPLLELHLDRALPDLRRRFEGRSTSRFSLDINGQAGHGTGTIEAWWGPEGPVVEMRPSAPWWLAERPMRTEIRYLEDGSARVHIARIPLDEAP
jgi:hypothetical protein